MAGMPDSITLKVVVQPVIIEHWHCDACGVHGHVELPARVDVLSGARLILDDHDREQRAAGLDCPGGYETVRVIAAE